MRGGNLRFCMDGLGQRIRISADRVGGLDAMAPMLTGVSRRTLTDWVSDKTEPRASSLAEICQVTGARIDWLVTGEGEMLQRYTGIDETAPQDVDDLDRPDFVRLPIYNEIQASAGPGATVPATEQADGVVAFARPFLRDLGATPDRCSIIWARGDSMQPTIPDGSILVVDCSQTDVVNGCIYVLNVDDDLLVKRVRRRLDATIEIVSDNAMYPPESLRAEQLRHLRVVGRVVYFCRTP